MPNKRMRSCFCGWKSFEMKSFDQIDSNVSVEREFPEIMRSKCILNDPFHCNGYRWPNIHHFHFDGRMYTKSLMCHHLPVIVWCFLNKIVDIVDIQWYHGSECEAHTLGMRTSYTPASSLIVTSRIIAFAYRFTTTRFQHTI